MGQVQSSQLRPLPGASRTRGGVRHACASPYPFRSAAARAGTKENYQSARDRWIRTSWKLLASSASYLVRVVHTIPGCPRGECNFRPVNVISDEIPQENGTNALSGPSIGPRLGRLPRRSPLFWVALSSFGTGEHCGTHPRAVDTPPGPLGSSVDPELDPHLFRYISRQLP